MDLSARPIANPDAVLREEFDDWAVLFNPDTADALGINPVGVAVWKLLDGQRTVQEIVEQIGELFDGVPGDALDHVTSFLEHIATFGLVGFDEAVPAK